MDKVRNWRQLQLDGEMARLKALNEERDRVEAQRAQLACELSRSTANLLSCQDLMSEDLQALNAFAGYVQDQDTRLQTLARQVGQAIEKQRSEVSAAQRNVEMLDLHREKRLAEWKEEVNREQESLVAELVVARWKASNG